MRQIFIDRARRLRRQQTGAEGVLWYHLRDRRLLNFRFKRQHRIGPYIVDFFCREYRLVIEADGGQHSDQVEQDQLRTHFLESRGLTVVRFWNDDVLANIDGVLEAILNHLAPTSP